MAAPDHLPHYTYDDYKLWEGNWELYEGFPVAMSPAPMIIHQTLAGNIITQLNNGISEECYKCAALGEADYKLADDTILRPGCCTHL